MKYGAVIVENRKLNIPEIVDRHKRFLPEDWKIIHYNIPSIKTRDDYSALMTNYEFWNNIPFDKVLIFQQDSGLLRKGIYDFLQYDYIGAPFYTDWKHLTGGVSKGGNGGLSLRGKEATLKTIQNIPFKKSRDYHEDFYYSKYIDRYGNLAPRSECEKFSVEGIKKMGTLGYHHIDLYLSEQEVYEIMTQYWKK